MKKIFFMFAGLLLAGCSVEEPDPKPAPSPSENPVAVDDVLIAVENEQLVFSTLLENDTTVDNARIYEIDSKTAKGGSIKDNRDNTYTYTPPQNFLGEDTFSYIICVPGDSERCSSAEVVVKVEDAGSPKANDDNFNVLQGTSVKIVNLLENDEVVDNAIISSISNVSTGASVVLNEDGTVTYTPESSLVGEDTFSYTLCDNDEPENSCSTATVTITIAESVAFNIPAELEEYYSAFGVSTNEDLNFDLISEFTTEKHTTILSYGQRHDYLYEADEDLNNPDNVILMYTGESRYWEEYWSDSNDYEPQTFNTEHIYPQSRLNSEFAVTDLHHLRASDSEINSTRLNYPFTTGSGEAKLVGDDQWYPGDEWKGDVARMVMYLNVRYGEPFTDVGNQELFLKWNTEDPVSPFEIQRNNVIESAQGNRNPFIDNPYLATLIWGGTPAENKW